MTNEEIAAELEALNENATPGRDGTNWGYLIAEQALKEFYRNHHAAIVSALRGKPPAGYVIVPREPTNKMLQAHPIASDLLPVEVVMQRRREIWSAMLTASEQKP